MGCSSVDREHPKQTSGHSSSPANILGVLVLKRVKRKGRGRKKGQGISKERFTFESFVHSHGVAYLLFLRVRGSSETQ